MPGAQARVVPTRPPPESAGDAPLAGRPHRDSKTSKALSVSPRAGSGAFVASRTREPSSDAPAKNASNAPPPGGVTRRSVPSPARSYTSVRASVSPSPGFGSAVSNHTREPSREAPPKKASNDPGPGRLTRRSPPSPVRSYASTLASVSPSPGFGSLLANQPREPSRDAPRNCASKAPSPGRLTSRSAPSAERS